MSHGYAILEMVKMYERKAKRFGKITKDIMENNTIYCGVLQLTETLDLLFQLYSNDYNNAVNVAIYRGFPKDGTAAGIENNDILLFLTQVLSLFPEIKKIEFQKDKFPKPYSS